MTRTADGSTSSTAGSQHSLKMPSEEMMRIEPELSGPPDRIELTIPHNLLVLPASAALVGLVIGMSRGGSRARLRFLAENAHRPPTTIQGWYFYTKTRNYRVFFSAAKMGAKYALGLGGATAGFVLLDEGAGWTRERIMGEDTTWMDRKGKGRAVESDTTREHVGRLEVEAGGRTIVAGRKGWRSGPVHWEDGAVAGMVMGASVGLLYTLPRPLFIRALVMGTLLGGATSGLQTAQDYVGRLRAAQEESLPRSATSLPPIQQSGVPSSVLPISGPGGEHGLVDRELRKGEKRIGVPIDETAAIEENVDVNKEATTSSWYSWIPGFSK